MTLPLSQNSDTKVFLIFFSAAIVAAQSWLGDIAWWIPVANWAVSALFALGIQDFISRNRLGNVRHSVPFVIAWVLLTSATNFAALYLEGDMPLWKILLQMGALLVILNLTLMTWQRTDAPAICLLAGIIVGLLSVIYAPTIYWLLVLFFAAFFMRSNSVRNFWSTLSGVFLGIWVSWVTVFFLFGEDTAGNILRNLGSVFPVTFALPEFSLQSWIFIAVVALLLAVYTSTGFLLNIGDSLRSTSCIQLFSVLAILFAVFTFLNVSQLELYVCLLSLLLAVQLTFHHTNLSSDIHEWWIIFVLITMMLLGIVPILIPLFM